MVRAWGRGILSRMDTSCVPAIDPFQVERSARTRRRVVALVIMMVSGAVLLLAAWFEPAMDGHGTHTQLGLPPCGWVLGMGIPCPSCGMTTSFAHAADGNLLGSFQAQPAGAMLAVGTAMVFVLSVWVLSSGSAIGGFWVDRIDKRVFIVGGAIILAAWIYKILVFKGVL